MIWKSVKLNSQVLQLKFFSVIDYFPGKVHHYMLEKSRVVHQEKVLKRKFIINNEEKMITL